MPECDANLLSEYWQTIIAVVFGGFVTFLSTYFFQSRQAKHTRSEADRTHRKWLQTSAKVALAKMTIVESDIAKLKGYFEVNISKCEELKSNDNGIQLWQVFLPLSNIPIPMALTDPEISALIELNFSTEMNEIINCQSAHRSIIDMIQKYNALRKALSERMPASHSASENLIRTNLTQEQAASVLPLIIDIESLLNITKDLIFQYAKYAEDTTESLMSSINRGFSDNMTISRKNIEELS